MRAKQTYRSGDEKDSRPPLIIYAGGTTLDITQEIDAPIYTCGFVKPHAYRSWENILEDIRVLSSRRENPLVVVYEKEDRFERERAKQHYRVLKERPFFNELIEMITEGPTRQFILTGNDAIRQLRDIVGATDPHQASPNTIRGMCASDKYGKRKPHVAYNAVHASDGLSSFIEEVYLHFARNEIGPEFWQRVDSYSAYLQALREFCPDRSKAAD